RIMESCREFIQVCLLLPILQLPAEPKRYVEDPAGNALRDCTHSAQEESPHSYRRSKIRGRTDQQSALSRTADIAPHEPVRGTEARRKTAHEKPLHRGM